MHELTDVDKQAGNLAFAKAPAIVIDKVSMTYEVKSESPDKAGSEAFLTRIMRIIRGGSTVQVAALKGLSLVVEEGESIGVIGLNGSGKSTLMKLICGKIKPTSGSIYASSTPIMLGVSAALMPDLSGAQNIELGCMAMGMNKVEVAKKYSGIVDLAGLEDSIHLPMRSYSSGMSSRLRFAIAASIDPEILIIDEALNTGDDEFKGRTKKRMDEIRLQAGCVFLVSHSLTTVRELCTRIIWLDKGELLYDGEPKSGLYLYQKYTKALAAKDYVYARRLRKRMITTVERTEIENRSVGRRKLARL